MFLLYETTLFFDNITILLSETTKLYFPVIRDYGYYRDYLSHLADIIDEQYP